MAETARFDSRDIARIAVFAALIAALGLVSAIPIPGLPVPVTTQTLGVMLAGAVLGPRRGAAAVAVFLLLVFIGLPLLSGGRGGAGVFAHRLAAEQHGLDHEQGSIAGKVDLEAAVEPGALEQDRLLRNPVEPRTGACSE